jgi:hypothetical protein
MLLEEEKEGVKDDIYAFWLDLLDGGRCHLLRWE